MNRIVRFKRKVVNYLFDHPTQKKVLKHSYYIIITIISAFIFSVGFKAFIGPNYAELPKYQSLISSEENFTVLCTLASCGGSGISQIICKIFELAGWQWLVNPTNREILFWIIYFCVNVPLFVLGITRIGKKFTIYSVLNVGFVSLFGILLPNSKSTDFINQIANYVFEEPIARIVFASLTTGTSSSLAYLIDSTAGGIDILAFYFGERKSKQVGGYTAGLNFIVITIFCIVSTISGGIIKPHGATLNPNDISAIEPALAVIMFLYTGLYMVLTSLVVNVINVFNKKECLQIITSNINLSQAILANIPHGCTIIDAKGGYSEEKKYLIYMTVRKNEAKKVIYICKKADPNCFINEFPLNQIHGKFFRKPIE